MLRTIVSGAQRLDGGELLAVGVSPLLRGVPIADLLVDQHPGNQEHTGAGAESELVANRQIEIGHRGALWQLGHH